MPPMPLYRCRMLRCRATAAWRDASTAASAIEAPPLVSAHLRRAALADGHAIAFSLASPTIAAPYAMAATHLLRDAPSRARHKMWVRGAAEALGDMARGLMALRPRL